MTGDELKVLARGRRKEHKVGGVKLRDFRLVSDKAQADCVEAMMGCYLLHCGMENCLDFMARIGINLSSTSRVEEVIERRKQSREKVIMQTPQKDAFCSDHVRNEKAKLQTLESWELTRSRRSLDTLSRRSLSSSKPSLTQAMETTG